MNTTLNTLRLLAVASLAVIGSAQASEADSDYPWHNAPFVQQSSTTRADVIAALNVARANNQLDVGEAGLMPAAAKSLKTRAQVVAELHEARRLGLVGHGEVSAPAASAEQLRRIADAGLHARGDTAMAQMR